MNSPCRLLLLLALFTLAPIVDTRACQVPVYRYALENWPAYPFRVSVFHRGPLTPRQREAFDWLPRETLQPAQKSASAIPLNITVHDVDLAAPDPIGAGLWTTLGNPELPWVVVQFPFQDQIADTAWLGKLDIDNMKSLADSPVRHELSRRLLRGDSAVWILVQKSDEKAAQISAAVEAELGKLETTLKLPPPEEGIERQSSSSGLKTPLKVGFSVIRLSENDPAEKIFLQILRRTSRNPVPADADVVAYPVFGRGRCLGGMAGESLAPKAIEDKCAFIIGACSCQVKGQNPGVDLPMLVKWDDFVKGSVQASKAMPPLTTLMPVAPMALASQTTAPLAPKESPILKASEAPPPTPLHYVTLKLSIFAVTGIAVILVSGCTFFIWRKPK